MHNLRYLQHVPRNTFFETMKHSSIIFAALMVLALNSWAQTNLILWQTNWPLGGTNNIIAGQQQLPNSSSWYTGTRALVVGASNGVSTNLVATVTSGSSLTFWTYFAPTNNASPTNVGSVPIQLSPNQTIRATVNFFVTGSAAQNTGRSLRFALLYAGTNANVTGSGNGSSIGLTGYGQNMNFGTTFGIAPLQTIAATNSLAGGSQLASSAQLVSIGSNGGGTTNDPGFLDNVNYTLELSVTENNPTNFTITTTFWGSSFANGSNITQTVTDTNYCYTNFDEFIMRPAQGAQTASTFNFTSFKIETFMNNVPSVSSNAFLSNLVLTAAGTLTPGFAPNVLNYTAAAAYGSAPTVTATSADGAATIQVIYDNVTNAVSSGSPSGALALNPNPGVPNILDVRVTAQDLVTVNDYLVNITQLPSQTPPVLTNSVSGGVLNLNWPLANLGYRLLMQTNNLNKGVSGNPSDWGTVAGSTATNTAAIIITKTNLNDYYRLVYP